MSVEEWIAQSIPDCIMQSSVKSTYVELFKSKRVLTMRQLTVLAKSESVLVGMGVEEIHAQDIMEL